MTNDDAAPPRWVSARHQLACALHAPPIASPEWWAGQWRVFGADEQRGFERARGEPARCWACRAIDEDTTLRDGDAR